MSYFRHRPDDRRAMFLSLTSQVESQLREAFSARAESGLTQTELARKLGVHKAAVSKRLNGTAKNLTLESIADLLWALDHRVEVTVFDSFAPQRGNGPPISLSDPPEGEVISASGGYQFEAADGSY